MNQGGLKNVVTEPTRLENKRERRRGAAGRAAALRRAPSDSDCSGETASLSADSGDRAVRPPPQPPRAGKNRGRRRGSEWEVLEGLKDGQRFEKRPDVFNGYLHKKRKWPLKGWHKRFFVIDGGILVYARSPTDVARGRLHGSVDVGLSVISAKARRRRIDIDADEFIYHLRAKTPDVFRTWLNVLKAHRLYRQHLLTFGARESVPKIHAPLDDLPATDNSSRTSQESQESSTLSTSDEYPTPTDKKPLTNETSNNSFLFCNSLCNPRTGETKDSYSPSKQSEIYDKYLKNLVNDHRSLCSMNCVARFTQEHLKRWKSPTVSPGSTDAEKQIHSTDLDINSIRTIETLLEDEVMISRKFSPVQHSPVFSDAKRPIYLQKIEPTTAYFFFAPNKSSIVKNSPMKTSKKSTNVVKYRNEFTEPTLQRPLSKCMLLGKYKMKVSRQSDTERSVDCSVACDPVKHESNEVQVTIVDKKALQDAMTTSDYDMITEKLLVSIFQNHRNITHARAEYYVKQVVKDLYDFKFQDVHPVKALFRSLLEYWLKNTSVEPVKGAMKQSQSIDAQSNNHFTKDQNLSSVCISNASKQTQFHGISEMIEQYKRPHPIPKTSTRVVKDQVCTHYKPQIPTESFEKERRIQELERLLKSTVYMCGTMKNDSSIQKDIKTTKALIDNIGKASHKSGMDHTAEILNDTSNSSTEQIKETINHLISETSIPPDVAKELLGAYLDVLMKDESKTTSNSLDSQSSEQLISSKVSNEKCINQVQTEAVTKRVSKSVTTFPPTEPTKVKSGEAVQPIDQGQMYLKDILDKITTIFSKVKHLDEKSKNYGKQNEIKKTSIFKQKEQKDELGRPVRYLAKNLIYENFDENSVVIDLTEFDLEHISMFSDPAIEGIMSITIKLKEKPATIGECKRTHLNLQFAESQHLKPAPVGESKRMNDESQHLKKEPTKEYAVDDNWIKCIHPMDAKSIEIFQKKLKSSKNTKNTIIDSPKQFDLKPYSSSSDDTSKAYKMIHESEHSLDLSFNSSNCFRNEQRQSLENQGSQSCYLMSFKKEIAQKFHSGNKSKPKQCTAVVLAPRIISPHPSTVSHTELSIFEKPAPRVIDEKFILLLLENLSLLSKNIPSLHKEINNLFTKLMKKHEKILKNCDHIQGLSLLGKIYNEDLNVTDKRDAKTQGNFVSCSCFVASKDIHSDEKAVNTCNKHALQQKHDLRDANISAIDLTLLMNSEVQTLSEDDEFRFSPHRKAPSYTNTSLMSNMAKTGSTHSGYLHAVDCSTSNSNWVHKTCRKDCSMTTTLKCMLEGKNNNTHKITRLQPTQAPKVYVTRKKKATKMTRQDVVKEISLIPPAFKVSTQSQTDRNMHRFVREKMMGTDYNLYQLFISKKFEVTRTSSLTESSVEVNTSEEMKTLYRCSSDPSFCSGLMSPGAGTIRGPQAGFVSGTPGGRLAGWIIESGGPLDSASRELGQAQLSVQQLQRLLDALELQQQLHHDTDVSIEGASPSVKKDRRKFGLRKKKSNSKCASVEFQGSYTHIDPSSSHMALSALTAPPSPGGGASSMPNSAASLPIACAAARPQSLPAAETLNTMQGPASLTSLTPDHQLREDFTVLAKDLVANLKTVVSTLVCERSRLRAAMEAAETAPAPGAVVAALRSNLSTALQQNSELRSRLSRIHDTSDLAEISSVGPNSEALTRMSPQMNNRPFQQSLSYSSSCVSASEFFDAEEHEDLKTTETIIAADESGVIELEGDSSSEAGSLSSEEGSASSDNSDGARSAEQVTLRAGGGAGGAGGPLAPAGWSRRVRLPAARPTPGGPSLWNLLYKNIGKDLSQISMPVTINEPLNMLQRLCEELEYSELLDSASECKNAIERMALVASFAVSAYASSAHRAASKPFNPLLAETYECVRHDRGFRFLAEQVSHHPPISACHAESSKWCFWQEARIKTKFWGKSMEFQPTGRVHVRLLSTGDHYSWNKVTTCVHNLFGGQRWVDQYGDMHITCHGTDITCKLNFIKASSWSSSRHEVRGFVSGAGQRLRLQGRWSEALYAGDPPAARCLWRPGAMPPEHEMYYGFTRFAMELNEMEPAMRGTLPHTDTRLRPDQRALEEGDVDAAEELKHQLEQSQRDRRRDSSLHQAAWFRKTQESGEETWVFNGEYWKAREAGFPDDVAPAIW